jgi:hypothetical protein
VDDSGIWLSPYVYEPDYVHDSAETGGSFDKSLSKADPLRVITIATGTVTVVLMGTAIAGGDILEGSLQLKVEDGKACWRLYDGMDILHDCTLSLQRLSMRHDIHSQAKPSSPWHEVFICPHLRYQSTAFDGHVEVFKSKSK